MDKTRILPPSVRGKVTGVLNFFIDEIRLFRNILLTNNFDLIVQIHWWGEVIPAHVRPEKFEVEDRNCETSEKFDCYYHSTKYEIKTTWDLFKAYLGTCEVVELSVLDMVENYVVGSAFLRDLVNLPNKNNELITLPIFDYLGEQIGYVIIHINLVEFPEEESTKVPLKITPMFQNNSVSYKPDKHFGNISNTLQSNFLREKTIFSSGYFKKNLEGERHVESGLPFDRYNFKIKKKENSNSSQSGIETNGLYRNCELNLKNNLSEEELSKCFPEVKTSNDSSKILYFGVSSQQSRERANIKNPNLKLANKFNSNSIKFKSKPSSACELGSICSEKNSIDSKAAVRRCRSFKNLTKKSVTAEEDKFFDRAKLFHQNITTRQRKDCRTSSASSRSETVSSHQTDVCGTPLKDSSNVLDYLLGSSMSKEDEKIALSDFKQMSPSHNLVSSISQLCLIPDHGTQNPDLKTGPENRSDSQKLHQQPSLSGPVKQTHLTFDFENPIERSYYEKFFLKSNSPGGFEIAEFLNQPENRFVVGGNAKTTDLKNGSETGSLKSCSKLSNAEREVLEHEDYLGEDLAEDEDYFRSIGGPDRKKSCARCKYYKKLDELDIIIESLKHFEQKMISHEKNIQAGLNDRSDMAVKKISHKTVSSPVI